MKRRSKVVVGVVTRRTYAVEEHANSLALGGLLWKTHFHIFRWPLETMSQIHMVTAGATGRRVAGFRQQGVEMPCKVKQCVVRPRRRGAQFNLTPALLKPLRKLEQIA